MEAITKNGLIFFKNVVEVILDFLNWIFFCFDNLTISECGFSPITIMEHSSDWSNFIRFNASFPAPITTTVFPLR